MKFMVVFFFLVSIPVSAASNLSSLSINGSTFLYPSTWKKARVRGTILPPNTAVIAKENLNCVLQSQDLMIDTTGLDYTATLSEEDWMELMPNFAIANDFKLIQSGRGVTSNGLPIWIATVSFSSVSTRIFMRVYLGYTGTKMIAASCSAESDKSDVDAKESMQIHLGDVHFIGKNFK